MSQSYARAPRFQILANGVLLPGAVQATWQQTNAFQSATFSFALALPPDGGGRFNGKYWAATEQKSIKIEILAATNNAGFKSQLTGRVDGHAFDPINGTLQANGRDLAGVFIDARTASSYPNLTASEIAQKLGGGHPEITAVVAPATTTLAGRYYADQYDQTNDGSFSNAVNEWDLLCLLGQKEGIIPYVQGTTLYFQKPSDSPPQFNIWFKRDSEGRVSSNATTITLNRSLTLSRDISVTVKSWNSAKKSTVYGRAITKSVKRIAGDTTPPTNFVFEFPNLTKAQADIAAQREAMDLATHERTASFEVPGEIDITPQHVINLTGTGTDYDTLWYPTVVSRTLSTSGFKTTINAQNSSTITLYDQDSGQQVGGQAPSSDSLQEERIQ